MSVERARPGNEDYEGALSPDGSTYEVLPPLFAEVLTELEQHQNQLGGLKYFAERPYIERKMKRKELTSSHSDYEYIYLTVLGLARLHLCCEEIIRRNNEQSFHRNPAVQMLERITGLTMHPERGGSNHLLRSAPGGLIQAFNLAKTDPGGPLQFFAGAFDRTADPCLEGRMCRIMAYVESRQRAVGQENSVPPWEDFTVQSLPDSASSLDVLGEHLRVFLAECTWGWAQQHSLNYEEAIKVRQDEQHAEDFAQIFNASTFESAALARGWARDARPALWESASKGGEWIPYDPDVSLRIDEAFNQDLAEVHLCLGPKSWRYVIDLAKMVQRNPKTGQERPLRRTAASAPARGGLTRDELALGIRRFVELETLPPTPA